MVDMKKQIRKGAYRTVAVARFVFAFLFVVMSFSSTLVASDSRTASAATVGGALGKMLPAFLAGGGGRLGTGKQYMSWLALDDAIYLIHRALVDQRYAGPINAVAPVAPTNAEFTEVLGKVLHRPTFLPVPTIALTTLFGEMAHAAILASQRVVPEPLRELGFEWRYPELEAALRHLLGG